MPDVADREIESVRNEVNAAKELDQSRSTDEVREAFCACAALFVPLKLITAALLTWIVAPVRVPSVESNRPKLPVWLISVVANGLLKLKLTVLAFALKASAEPTNNAAIVFN